MFLNLTADPMILAEAQRVVAEVQQEARQSRDQVISEARVFRTIIPGNSVITSTCTSAGVQGRDFPMKLLSMFQAITRDFQSQVEVARQFGIQARDQLQDLSARFPPSRNSKEIKLLKAF